MYQTYDPIPRRPNYPALALVLGGVVVFGLWVAAKHGGQDA